MYQTHQQTIQPTQVESDEQIITRLRERFDVLDDMTRAVKQGKVRAMIVTGAPGVGKSHGIERVLALHDMMATVGDDPSLKGYDIITGAISPLHMYLNLYMYKEQENVLVFDDVNVWNDEDMLNMLKNALDTSKRRFIGYKKQSRVLEDAGIPTKFEYKGGIIFVTNVRKEMTRSAKIRAHLEALESRCHFLDLTINTDREKLLRIKQIVQDGMLHSYRISPEREAEIVAWIEENQSGMREMSLRMVIKAAELVNTFGDDWKRHAEMTLIYQSTTTP